VLERELELSGKSFDAVTKLASLKRSKLVEERLNDSWVKDDHQQLE